MLRTHIASTRAWRACTSSVLVSSALTLAACGSAATPAENPAAPPATAAQPTSATPAAATTAAPASTPTAAATTPASQAPATLPAATGGAAGAAAPSTTPVSAAPAAAGITPAMAAGSTPTSATPATTTMPPTAAMGSGGQIMLAMDECGLHTSYGGDNYCINPPPPDKGFQIHLGPSNYDNPEPQWIMQPGNEDVENFTATSGNTTDVFYWRQYRMRPGTHHMILSSGGLDGHRIGGAQNLAYDNPEGGVIPDEDKDVGMKLAANTPLNINLHYINFTDKPILKEVWINVWYRDAADVKEAANEMYSFAPMNVPPGEHVVLRGVCPVQGDGRILTMYGHRHANNVRFSMWHEHGSMKDLVYEDYNWEDPLILQFSSVEANNPPDASKKLPGGWSGILNVANGDNMSFECEIINMSNKTFFGANEAKDDEMCIMIGDTVKTTVSNVCQYTTTQVTASGQ